MMVPLLVGGLAVLAAFCNLWWFALGSAAVLAWLHFSVARAGFAAGTGRPDPRRLRLGAATILSLVAYALLLSIGLLTIRAALGLLELPIVPFEQAQLAPALRRSTLGFYDKSELRLALCELALLATTFAVIFVQAGRNRVLQHGRVPVLHPATALFAFVLYFACVRLPPYPISLEQWGPLISLASGDGAWSFASGLSPVLLAAWLSVFGLSALSLSAAAALCNLAAGMASFALVRRLTGSPVAAMLGASYALLEATTIHAASVTSPAPAHVALAMLLLYLGLQHRTTSCWPALGLGLMLAWEPLFGAFACVSFLCALAWQAHRPQRIRTIAVFLAGIGLSFAAIWLARRIFAPVPLPAIEPGSEAQQFALPFPALIPGLLLVAPMLWQSVRGRTWTVRRLFSCASLICALPASYLAAFGADLAASFQAYWILLPSISLAIYTAVRVISRALAAGTTRLGVAFSVRASAVIFVVLFDVLFPAQRLNQVIARYAVRYELERQAWYRTCVARGACELEKPSLAFYLRQATRPLSHAQGVKRGPA